MIRDPKTIELILACWGSLGWRVVVYLLCKSIRGRNNVQR